MCESKDNDRSQRARFGCTDGKTDASILLRYEPRRYFLRFLTNRSLQPDAFKFWLMWKSLGDEGLRARVDRCVALADHTIQRISEREASDGALELVMAPNSFTNVLFRVVPPSLRKPRKPGDSPVVRSPQELKALGKAAPLIKAAMQRDGDALIGFQEYGEAQYGNEEINFFRMVVSQGDILTNELLDHTLNTMIKHSEVTEKAAVGV